MVSFVGSFGFLMMTKLFVPVAKMMRFPPMPGKRVTKEELNRVLALIKEGKSVRVAAHLIGRNERTIYRIIKRMNA